MDNFNTLDYSSGTGDANTASNGYNVNLSFGGNDNSGGGGGNDSAPSYNLNVQVPDMNSLFTQGDHKTPPTPSSPPPPALSNKADMGNPQPLSPQYTGAPAYTPPGPGMQQYPPAAPMSVQYPGQPQQPPMGVQYTGPQPGGVPVHYTGQPGMPEAQRGMPHPGMPPQPGMMQQQQTGVTYQQMQHTGVTVQGAPMVVVPVPTAAPNFQQELYARCARGDHDYETKFGMMGIILAIVFFPIGLLCLFVDAEKKCVRCGNRVTV